MQQPGTSAQTWIDRGAAVLIGNYRRQPVAFARGQGAMLWDTAGREYVDFCGGIAVSALGHGHPALAAAVAAQAGRLIHASNLYWVPEQVELAEDLRAWTGYERYLFCNSGTEANEAALKLLRAWGAPQGRDTIVVMRGGFHGRTLGALSATAQDEMQSAFRPLLPGFEAIPFADLAAARAAIGPTTAGVLVEPIQAEGGGHVPPPGYLAGLREICDAAGALLVFDEVQTGMGRSGAALASLAEGVRGDAVTLAKGLAGGVPIGALAIRESLAEVLGPGSHGSTFGGNPLACAAARAVLAVASDPALLARIERLGEQLRTELAGWTELGVMQPRGRGLWIAFDVPDAAAVVAAAREAGLLVAAAKGAAIRLLPPLTISDEELAEGMARLRSALAGLAGAAA